MTKVDDEIKEIANIIVNSKIITFFTGAGISTPSGLPDFRSPDGLWAKYDMGEYGAVSSFRKNPEKVWRFFRETYFSYKNVKPNKAHYAITELQELIGTDKIFILTQNIDNLHQEAGSSNIYELHGTMQKLHCLWCHYEVDTDEEKHIKLLPYPKCPHCNNPLKPKIVLFGEYLPQKTLQISMKLAKESDIMIAVGTSLEIHPASEIFIFSESPHKVMFNLNNTRYSQIFEHFIQGDVSDTLPLLVKEVKELMHK